MKTLFKNAFRGIGRLIADNEGDLLHGWAIPTLNNREPFVIILTATKAGTKLDGSFVPHHELRIQVEGLRHPHAREYQGVDTHIRNPALLPAMSCAQNNFYGAIRKAFAVDKRLAAAQVKMATDFGNRSNDNISVCTVQFYSNQNLPKEMKAIENRKVTKLFEHIRKDIELAFPAIAKLIEDHQGLNLPPEPPPVSELCLTPA